MGLAPTTSRQRRLAPKIAPALRVEAGKGLIRRCECAPCRQAWLCVAPRLSPLPASTQARPKARQAHEKQTPGRPKCFSSPSGGRTPHGGGLGGTPRFADLCTLAIYRVHTHTSAWLPPGFSSEGWAPAPTCSKRRAAAAQFIAGRHVRPAPKKNLASPRRTAETRWQLIRLYRRSGINRLAPYCFGANSTLTNPGA